MSPIWAAAAALAVSMTLAGCAGSSSLTVQAPRPTGPVATQCAGLVDAVPEHVAGQSRRTLSPATSYAAAWGDPPIVLRCGGAKPPALRPSSQCFVVDEVGWLATQNGKPFEAGGPPHGTLDFTTIGRSAYVEVSVPDAYQPAADALVDLARVVKVHTSVEHPCQ